jgi:hypothetical protein
LIQQSRNYTPEVFHSQSKTGAKASGVASGDLSGVLQQNTQAALLEHWENLSKDQQDLVFELIRVLSQF